MRSSCKSIADKPTATGSNSLYYQANPESLTHANNIGHLVKDVYASLIRMIDSGVAPLGLTATQWRPLVILRYGDIDTPAELARRTNVDSGAMTRTLDRLEAKGFLTRRRCQDDRRVVKLELTPTGHEVVNDILPAVANTLNTHLNGFSKTEISQLLDFLQRLIANGMRTTSPIDDTHEP